MSRRAWGSSLLGVLLIILSTLPLSAPTASATVAPPTKFEAALLTHINNHRAAIGCTRLSYNSYLAYAARKHTALMVRYRTVSHQLSGEASLGRRITLAGYTPWSTLAENLAMGPTTPWSTYMLWMRSAPHKANIENCRLRNAALGVTMVDGRAWATIDFGRH